MPKLAANLSMMFNEIDFIDRFEAAGAAGFKGIEYLFPYACEADDLRRRLDTSGLTQVLFNMPPGDWAAGERGLACLPDRTDEFKAGVDLALTYARALGCKRIHAMAGLIPEGFGPREIRETYVNNLAYAAERLKEQGITLLIEPINTRDMPGYYLNYSLQTFDIIEDVGADNIALQYDVYHAQVMEGDIAPTLSKFIDRIGHVQIADTPGRHEPGTGEINYPFVLSHLDAIGYQGWVGCEYIPADTTLGGLGWADAYLKR